MKALNILDYLYFYNGGGVASGDINNDGLADLFFTSNLGQCKLYKNNGDYTFQDITHAAGIVDSATWKTGVTMADVNGDGLLDIYVCCVSGYKNFTGHNALFINQGNGRFREESAQYGLDFKGFSTQAAFFDYDKDGDLDMVLICHAVHSAYSYGDTSLRSKKSASSGTRLFRNDHGHFTDVTDQAGIFRSPIGYDLGVAIGDVNQDGWDDFYVSNDFHEDDYLYINQKNGTFKEELAQRMGHTSRFSMGNDLADINNDGWPDLITIDMLPENEQVLKRSAGDEPYDLYMYKRKFGYKDQYARNCLQVNQGNGEFSDVCMFAGLEATDWSWSPLLADFNNDGFTDVFVSNGILRRPNDLDYLKYISTGYIGNSLNNSKEADLQAIAQMPEGKTHNYLFVGEGQYGFTDDSQKGGFSVPTLSNGATYADLSNDGNLDLVTNNINEEARLFKNNSPRDKSHHFLEVQFKGEGRNTFGIGTKIFAYDHGKTIYRQLETTRGFQSSVSPIVHMGLGKMATIDSLLIIWPDDRYQLLRKALSDRRLLVWQKDATGKFDYLHFLNKNTKKSLFQRVPTSRLGLSFKHKENTFTDFDDNNLLPFKLSTEGPKMAIADVNRDGLDDIYICGAKGQARYLYLQTLDKKFVRTTGPFTSDTLYEDTDALWLDVNGDNNPDLVVASGGYEKARNDTLLGLRVYLNDGKGKFLRQENPDPKFSETVSCLRAVRYRDQTWLFVGSRAVGGGYGLNPGAHLYKIEGGKFIDVTAMVAPEMAHLGMVTDATWTDIDGDGNPDLVVVGDWMPVTVFIRESGKLVNQTKAYGLSESQGLWRSLAVADMDGDGKPDLVCGNLGLNTHFTASAAHPLLMYTGDFGRNGQLKQIICQYKDGKYVFINSKDELQKQMPFISQQFNTYQSFASKTIEEVLSPGEMHDAVKQVCHRLASCIFYQGKNHAFVERDLPVEAQLFPVFAIVSSDVNGDGIRDLIFGGNFFGASLYNGKLDAGRGLVLLGASKNAFRPLTVPQSGLNLKGEIKDIKPITVGGQSFYLFTQNNDSLNVIQKR